MERMILNYIRQNEMICRGDTVVAGISGGADSMALLHILKEFSRSNYIKIIAAHINHNLRGRESDLDEMLVRDYCDDNGIQLKVLSADIKGFCALKGLSLEEGGRIVRYNFFNLIKRRNGSVKVATGHHKDDQVETVLMRIIRGTGINGLKGIDPVREDGVIRPLLLARKSDILNYCREKSIPYRHDASNMETDYHRNSIRHELMPLLKKYNPIIDESIANLSKIAREYEEHITAEVDGIWHKYKDKASISYNELSREAPLVQKKVLLRKYKEICDNIKFQQAHLEKAVEKIGDKEDTTWTVSLPNDFLLRRSYDKITVESKKTNRATPYFEYKIYPGKSYILSKIKVVVETALKKNDKKQKKPEKQGEFLFDYDKIIAIGEHIVLRQRKPGDRIRPLGHKKKRKIKEILIDNKIPSDNRDGILVFEVGNEIIWLAGVAASEDFKVTEDTKKIMRLAFYKIQEEINV